MNQTFFDLYMKGKATIDDLDDYLDEWHDGSSSQSIEDYLGLTKEQYFKWCQDPVLLKNELDKIRESRHSLALASDGSEKIKIHVAKELVSIAKELVEN